MGCDIHLYAEVRNGDRWEAVSQETLERIGARRPWWDKRGEYPFELYDGRHYRLFGVLAGVRDDDVTPIAPPRGLPDDIATKEYRSGYRREVWFGEHSFSWLMLRELEAVDWPSRLGEDPDRFVTETIPLLRKLGGPDDVRIVFGFDS